MAKALPPWNRVKAPSLVSSREERGPDLFRVLTDCVSNGTRRKSRMWNQEHALVHRDSSRQPRCIPQQFGVGLIDRRRSLVTGVFKASLPNRKQMGVFFFSLISPTSGDDLLYFLLLQCMKLFLTFRCAGMRVRNVRISLLAMGFSPKFLQVLSSDS